MREVAKETMITPIPALVELESANWGEEVKINICYIVLLRDGFFKKLLKKTFKPSPSAQRHYYS